jgi:hypothetical protein
VRHLSSVDQLVKLLQALLQLFFVMCLDLQ